MSSISGISSAFPVSTSSASQGITSPKPRVSATGSGTGTSSTASTESGLTSSAGSTFLNLLVQELQNQDPTAPMDSTQMVGQMISLNQLDQLMSINQDLSGLASSTGSSNSSAVLAARAALANTNPSAVVNPSADSLTSDPTSVLDLSALTNPNGVH